MPSINFVPRQTLITAEWLNEVDDYVFGGGISSGKLRTASVTSVPTLIASEDSIENAFTGDISKIMLPIKHYITGASTLTQPTTGYVYVKEAYPHYTYLYNSSGWNQGTSTNTGRTAAVAYRTKVYQAGQGDAVAYNGSVFVTGTKSGSTHFLANPAGVLFNGDMQAGADGVYLNGYETIYSDGGFDAAGIGLVNNFNRTVATGAKSAVWMGYRAQSVGSASCDTVVSATGKWITGVDFTPNSVDFGSNQAAISLKSGQRIYFNNNANASGNLEAGWRTTGFNGDYITHTTSGFTGLNFVQAGASRLQVGSTVTVNTSFAIAVASVGNYANDAAAAAGGVPVNGVYRNGSTLQIRVS